MSQISKLLQKSARFIQNNYLLSGIIILAWILTLLPFVFDGRYICIDELCGYSIGTNYRDGAWFLAVSNASFKSFPFEMPNYAGTSLQGYHYLPNLFAYGLSRVGIPITTTYFQIIPLLYISLITIIILKLGKSIVSHPLFTILFSILFFFGMHLSILTSLYHKGFIDNGALINTFQATRILESPHTALAFLFLFSTILILNAKNRSETKHFWFILLAIFLSMGIKVYVAVTLISIFFLYEILLFVRSRNIKHIKKMCAASLVVLTGYTVFYYNSSNVSIFSFSPFATTHHLIESDGLFYQPKLVLARYFLYEYGWSPRLMLIELYSTLLFLLYYLGVRVLGLAYLFVQGVRKKLSDLDIAIGVTIVVDLIASVLFVQRGDWYNPMQFAVPAAFLASIYTAKLLFSLVQTYKKIGLFCILFVVVITFPGHLINLTYPYNKARYLIPPEEMQALTFLGAATEGSVFYPIDENDMMYVTAFSGKPGYVNYLNVLENAGIDYTSRLKNTAKPDDLNLTQLNVEYIYLSKRLKNFAAYKTSVQTSNRFKTIFENRGAIIYSPIRASSTYAP